MPSPARPSGSKPTALSQTSETNTRAGEWLEAALHLLTLAWPEEAGALLGRGQSGRARLPAADLDGEGWLYRLLQLFLDAEQVEGNEGPRTIRRCFGASAVESAGLKVPPFHRAMALSLLDAGSHLSGLLRVLGNARDDAELAWLGLSIAALGARARDPRLGRVDVGDREASNEPWPVVLEALNSATLRGSGKGAAGEGKLEQVVRLHGEKLRKACGGRPADILLCLAVLAHTPWLWEALVADEQLPVKDRSVLSRTRPEGRVEICARKAFA